MSAVFELPPRVVEVVEGVNRWCKGVGVVVGSGGGSDSCRVVI